MEVEEQNKKKTTLIYKYKIDSIKKKQKIWLNYFYHKNMINYDIGKHFVLPLLYTQCEQCMGQAYIIY